MTDPVPAARVPEETLGNSKKFLAFLFIELVLAGMGIASLLVTRQAGFNFTVCTATMGFVAVGYILGQAGLERYVRVAAITANAVRGKETVVESVTRSETVAVQSSAQTAASAAGTNEET